MENPTEETHTVPAESPPAVRCPLHERGHRHGPGCGHPPVVHDGHTDYQVGPHLHHPHGDHCDEHGGTG